MRRRAGCVSLAIALSLFAAVSKSAAAPLSVAYVDNLTGLEWAQVTGSTGFQWWEVDAVCANDGSTACSSNLAGVELAGWTWARTNQIMDLMANATDLSSAQLSLFTFDPAYGTVFVPLSVTATDSTWAPQFLSLFAPTLVTGTSQAVIGWAANGAYFDPRSAFIPAVIDAAPGGEDSAGRGNLVDSAPPFSPAGSSERGVWLFRTAQQVPEPSTLLLLSVGALGALRWRERHEKRSSQRP